ncbi:FecR family protein [Mangrovibacterium diazotrophicum]|uniref:FecR family protein n=1 Tax=Mangrovibacterium diazotrophicum TaxID=1261403 RepID=A0A419VUX6_9BACT|nr:FecR domain-containing protein [Mangrovibacterium diazotrophicum]RKD85153.1 FecR family protein [Mangrovibacterium diazotrophicum]
MKQYESRESALIVKYIKGEITDTELTELDAWIGASASNKQLFESLLLEENFEIRRSHSSKVDLDKAYQQLQRKIAIRQKPVAKTRVLNWKRFSAVAASILIPLAIGVVVFMQTERQPRPQVATIEAGNHKAQLFFSSGERIELDENTTDTIYKDNTSLVADHGMISYSNEKAVEAQINRIVVPRGGEFQMVLADGTKVWLNSESELVFPTVFNEATRSVEVSGEAYFEVTKNKEKPFIVKTGGQQIKVLGTAFNVRNYSEEERAITTLVEGSIALTPDAMALGSVLLSPGEQTILDFATVGISKQSVDVSEFVSWKEGEYIFKSKPLVDVMNELARWYDLDVEFGDESIKRSVVTGKFKRVNTFNAFVDLLDKIEVAHFEISGNKVTITE